MDGSFNKTENTLHLKVTNLNELKGLLQKAQKQADELQKTISRLEFFDLKFEFSADNAITFESS